MALKRRKKTLRLATMDDFEWINDLFRKQHKKRFSYLTANMIKERIEAGSAYVSRHKKYCEIIRIYKKKTKIADGENGPVVGLPGDVNLRLAASTEMGKGIGTKYRKRFIKQLYKTGRKMFSILHHTNIPSATYNQKCGLEYFNSYVKNNHKYIVYIYICRGSKNKFKC